MRVEVLLAVLLACASEVGGTARRHGRHGRHHHHQRAAGGQSITLKYPGPTPGTYAVSDGVVPGGIVTAAFDDTIATTGWAELRVSAGGAFQDRTKVHAAGFAEGYLTWSRIRQFYDNQLPSRNANAMPKLYAFFEQQDAWLRGACEKPPDFDADTEWHAFFDSGSRELFDAYWRQICLVMAQLDGLVAGQNARCDVEHAAAPQKSEACKVTKKQVWLLNMDGDIIELERAIVANELVVGDEAEAAQAVVVTGAESPGAGGTATGNSMSFREKHLGLTLQTRRGVPPPPPPRARARAGGTQGEEEGAQGWQKSLLGALSHRFAETGVAQMQTAGAATRWQTSLLRSLGHRQRPAASGDDVVARQGHRRALLGAGGSPTSAINAKWRHLMLKSRCSVVLRLTDKNEDLLVGHNAWEDYSEMTRIFKHFNLRLSDPRLRAPRASFSSYPAMLASTDDFYILSSKLVVTETTLNILDDAALAKMRAKETLVSWVRNIVANRLAADGEEWSKLMALRDSYTYSCMWMVVDYNKFKKGAATLPAGTLWIVETVPGAYEMRDMTPELVKRRYWPSINRPYFDKTRAAAGYKVRRRGSGAAMEEGGGSEEDLSSFEDNPRGRIIRAKASGVSSVEDMKRLMRYNGYPADTLSKSPSLAVAARFDLDPGRERHATGAVDGKVVGAADVADMKAHIVSGPTTQDQAPFEFTGEWANVKHEGLPLKWDFDWIITQGFGGEK